MGIFKLYFVNLCAKIYFIALNLFKQKFQRIFTNGLGITY